ncbi:MAG TPA: hypothetical protein VMB53_09640 [Gaiellaceae bacterium]|nr:hypothetical protein [Gaiellaceae bacterium]
MRRLAIPSAAIVGFVLWPATASAATPAPDAPFIDTSHPVWFVFIIAGLFTALLFALVLYDRVAANKWRKGEYAKFAKMLLGDSEKDGLKRPLTTKDVDTLLRRIGEPPKSQTGLTRTLLALGLLALIAIALTALLVSDAKSAPDILKTVIVALTSSLTTILGFYFGAKTATEAASPTDSVPSDGGDLGTDETSPPSP